MDTRSAITIAQYRSFREDGFLIVRGVLDPGELGELLEHVDVVAGLIGPGELGNGRHILARGSTHLPYAEPRFAQAARSSTNVS